MKFRQTFMILEKVTLNSRGSNMKQVVLEASSVLIIIFWEEIGIWTQNQVAVGPPPGSS